MCYTTKCQSVDAQARTASDIVADEWWRLSGWKQSSWIKLSPRLSKSQSRPSLHIPAPWDLLHCKKKSNKILISWYNKRKRVWNGTSSGATRIRPDIQFKCNLTLILFANKQRHHAPTFPLQTLFNSKRRCSGHTAPNKVHLVPFLLLTDWKRRAGVGACEFELHLAAGSTSQCERPSGCIYSSRDLQPARRSLASFHYRQQAHTKFPVQATSTSP